MTELTWEGKYKDGKVNLIYIDPYLNVGPDFSFTATIADDHGTDDDETSQLVKQPSIIEQKAYSETCGKGLDRYMHWFYKTGLLLKELLAEDGNGYYCWDNRKTYSQETNPW
jgi:adenine-specific DNA-methyltransferase